MSDSTKPVLTWVRLLAGLGIVLFGLTALLDSVSTTDTPPRHCNGTAIQVAFTGGTGSRNLRDACRGEGRGQSEVGLVVSAIGVIVVSWRKVRRWAQRRDEREPGVTIWRRGNPLRPFAVVTVGTLVFLAIEVSGWDVVEWVLDLLLISPVIVPLTLVAIRPRIEARPDRLIIQNALDVRRFQWAEVAGAEATRRGIKVVLRDGRTVRAAAVRRPRRAGHGAASRADQVVSVLRARSKQAVADGGLVFGLHAPVEAGPSALPPPPSGAQPHGVGADRPPPPLPWRRLS